MYAPLMGLTPHTDRKHQRRPYYLSSLQAKHPSIRRGWLPFEGRSCVLYRSVADADADADAEAAGTDADAAGNGAAGVDGGAPMRCEPCADLDG